MKLTLRESLFIPDWYVIVMADGGGFHAGHADVEGSASEMIEIASAIECRGLVSFRRCAVRVYEHGDLVALWSPRNSIGDVRISLEDADVLALEIRRVLKVAK